MSTLAEEKADVTGAASAEDHSGRPSYDDVNVPFVVVLGVISAIVTYVSIVGVQGLYYHWEDAQIREKEYGATIAAAKTIEEQKELLDGFNQAKVRAEDEKPAMSIPIDLAMSLTLSEYANDLHSDSHGAAVHGPGAHDSDAGHGENEADAKSEDSPKAKEKVDDQPGVEKSDAEKKSDSKDSDKTDETIDEESKSAESKKEDAPEKGDDKE